MVNPCHLYHLGILGPCRQHWFIKQSFLQSLECFAVFLHTIVQVATTTQLELAFKVGRSAMLPLCGESGTCSLAEDPRIMHFERPVKIICPTLSFNGKGN